MRFRPEVPVLPQSRARVFRMLRDEGAQIGDMVDGIASDPALTGALLLAANSAHSSPGDRVGNIRDRKTCCEPEKPNLRSGNFP